MRGEGMPKQVSDVFDTNAEEKDTFHMDNTSAHSNVTYNDSYYVNYDEPDKDAKVAETKEDSMFVNPNEYAYVYEEKGDDKKAEEEDPYTFYVEQPDIRLAVASFICAVGGFLWLVIAYNAFFWLFLIASVLLFIFCQKKTVIVPKIAKAGVFVTVITIVISPWVFLL